MRITVHRGTDQIGGCVTEYESNGWKLFVDYGEQLPGAPVSDKALEIEGLTNGDLRKSALLITHYHGDHIGKIADLPPELPIFIGKISKEIAQELSEHLSSVNEGHRSMAERLDSVRTFIQGEQFSFGEFRVLPIVIDHSAFDAYAFRIEAKGLTVFHTGDFRTHGFRSGKLPKVIEKYVGEVDYVVCEATNVNRPVATIKTESELQKEFESEFRDSRYNVVYLSSTNVDRLFGLYHAAVKAHLPFYVDAYQKRIMDIVAGRDNIWGKSRLYRYVDGREPIVLQHDGADFRVTEKFSDFLEEHGYVLIARANDRFDKLLSKIPKNGRKTFLSMWNGYLDRSNAAYNPALAQYIGTEYEYLHTSGHCDMASLDRLLDMLKPKAIIPIHTDNPQRFAELFCEKWPVILLEDGESFAAICDPGFDTTTAKVMAFQEPYNSCEVIENPENLQWWMVDNKFLGEFQWWDDADSALHHVVYAPKRLLGYAIESDEDMAPFLYVVYNPDFTEHSEYNEGGHDPEDEHYQTDGEYTPGQRVLAVIDEVLVPCEVVGPVTVDFLRKDFNKYGPRSEEDFQEYKSELWDWDWDKVVVRPLVKIKTEYGEISSETIAQRINIFPYKTLSINEDTPSL